MRYCLTGVAAMSLQVDRRALIRIVRETTPLSHVHFQDGFEKKRSHVGPEV